MIYVVLLKVKNLAAFKKAVNAKAIELERFNIGTVPVVRIALIDFESFFAEVSLQFMVEQSILIDHKQYCLECLKQEDKFTLLGTQNKSGYCNKHRELDPKRIAKKQSPKNKDKKYLI